MDPLKGVGSLRRCRDYILNMDHTKFPDIFGLKGTTFLEVFNTKKEFVDFTANEMNDCTGIFAVWQKYVHSKLKTHNGSRPVEADEKIQS